IPRDRPRRVGQDSSRLLNRLPPYVVAHKSRLPRARPHVLGLRPNDRRRPSRNLPPPPRRRRLRSHLGLVLSSPPSTRAPPPRLRRGRVSLKLLNLIFL